MTQRRYIGKNGRIGNVGVGVSGVGGGFEVMIDDCVG